MLGVIWLYNNDYESKRWQQFLIYIAYTAIGFLFNAFGNHILPYFNRAAFIWSIAGFAIICITVLACAAPHYASATFVFSEFLNETNWPGGFAVISARRRRALTYTDGIAWLLGLLQGGLGITGYDAVAHMIEGLSRVTAPYDTAQAAERMLLEIPNAAKEGPKIMIAAVGIGMVTGFIFLMVNLFVSGGAAAVDDLIITPAGPLLKIFVRLPPALGEMKQLTGILSTPRRTVAQEQRVCSSFHLFACSSLRPR